MFARVLLRARTLGHTISPLELRFGNTPSNGNAGETPFLNAEELQTIAAARLNVNYQLALRDLGVPEQVQQRLILGESEVRKKRVIHHHISLRSVDRPVNRSWIDKWQRSWQSDDKTCQGACVEFDVEHALQELAVALRTAGESICCAFMACVSNIYIVSINWRKKSDVSNSPPRCHKP
jgi:hypothetical protein